MAANSERKYLEAQGGHPTEAPQPLPLPHTEELPQGPSKPKRGLVEAYILLIPLGWMGAHQFYLRRPGWGVLYLFTIGLFGIGYLTDFCRLPLLVKKANRSLSDDERAKEKSLLEAYILWFPCGLFGFHHFYLRRWGHGFWYLFTFGLLGLGWVIDGIAMPKILSEYRNNLQNNQQNVNINTQVESDIAYVPKVRSKSLITAYRLCVFPITGWFGGHHYYLGRVEFGLFYTFTLGGFGLGWFIDWLRLACLVKEVNKKANDGCNLKKRRLDDLYVLAIPMGLFGAHHFYLRRIRWGILYLFTFGIFGIGWLVDLVRMYWLLKAYHEQIDAESRQMESANISGHANPNYYSGDPTVGPTAPPPGQGPTVYPHPEGGYEHAPPGLPGQYAQTIAPGTYSFVPAPPYTAVPGVHPPVLPPVPPGYGAIGYNSWSTIESSDVDGPPSYESSVLQQSAQPEMEENKVNENKE